MKIDATTRCEHCERAMRWGQKTAQGQPLDDKTRAKLCYDCSAKRRKAGKVVALREARS